MGRSPPPPTSRSSPTTWRATSRLSTQAIPGAIRGNPKISRGLRGGRCVLEPVKEPMATDPMSPVPASIGLTKSLDRVLGQNEHIEGLMAASAEDLASVNLALKHELADGNTGLGIEAALEKSEAVEEKVLEASKKLSGVNQALKAEVEERRDLEGELAAAKEQGEADRHASLHDLLTGLPNRALFNDRLEHGLAQALRHGWSLAVMFVDLDDFKAINDSYGHDAGDAVLRIIADRLGSTRDETPSAPWRG
ncbi:MAG: GGDEF domain-containing protein [Holophagaceae bacterium]|nr:GGDEF domain-containing protein [Holophagaceae bacterium]